MDAELVAFALRFLNFSDYQDSLYRSHHVDHKQCEILRFVLRSFINQQPVKVSDVLLLRDIASQATIHKIIHELIALGLLKSELDPSDDRVKYLTPTATALALFSDMGKKIA